MSKVLVLGASGYIGFAVATRFATAGYSVFGITRTEEKGKLLSKNEIYPVLGQAQDTSKWLKVAEEVDIIVDALADYQDTTTAKTVADALVALVKRQPHTVIIYTSGVWVHGDTRKVNKLIVDEHVPTNPFPIVQWRPPFEKQYLDAGGIVLRPGLVYGKSGSVTGIWFEQLAKGKVDFVPNALESLVHIDDLAHAYVLAAAHAVKARGQIFNIVGSVENPAVAFAASKHLTNPALQIGTPAAPAAVGHFLEPVEGVQVLDSSKAKLVLGWFPVQKSFTVGLPWYYEAWKAYK